MGKKNFRWLLLVGVLLVLFVGVACGGTGGDGEAEDSEEMEDMEEMEHEEGEEHEEDMEGMEHSEEDMEGMEHEDDGEHEHGGDRVPNEGASIHIVSPESDAVAANGEVEVIVEVEDFELGTDDSHWHVYVDGESYGMVMGGDTSHVVRGIEPGEHELAVYLAYGTHEELEEGDTIMVTVEE